MKKRNSRRRALSVAGLIIVLAISLSAYYVFRSPISFVYYEPTYLPPGVEITEKRISINGTGKNKSEMASLRMERVQWTYSMNQYKLRPGLTIGSADQNYDGTSVKPTCSIVTTPKKQEYRLCHWIDNWESHGGSTVNVHQVKFIKGSTYFYGQVIAKNGAGSISVEDMSRFVDSFEERSTQGIPVKRSPYYV